MMVSSPDRATPAPFPETVWSTVLNQGDPKSPERRESLGRLLGLYWPSIHGFIRMDRRCTVDEASDLAQDFATYMIEQDLVGRYDRSKGRFRAFLKGVLRNFLAHVERDRRALKRGGGVRTLSIDDRALDGAAMLPDPGSCTPEEVFDRQWAADILAWAVEELRAECRRNGKEIMFGVLEAYELSDRLDRSYASVASELSLTVHQVKNLLDDARDALDRVIRGRVAETVATGDDLAAELKDLFSA